jgi:hypothetical protein
MSLVGSFSLLKFFRKKPSGFVPPPRTAGKKTLVLDLDETLIHSCSFPPQAEFAVPRVDAELI